MNAHAMPVLETKSTPAEVSSAFDEFHRAFTAFKEANDERLTQIETRLSSDAVTEEKVARIEGALDVAKRRLDGFALDRARPRLDAAPVRDETATREHKHAFLRYMRMGETGALKHMEEKALSAGSGADGGYLVPLPAEQEILRRLSLASPIRTIASVREISGPSLRKAFSTSGPAAGWAAETDPRTQGAAQKIADMTFPAMELYAMPAATQTLLDDNAVNLDQWIAQEVETVFAEQESDAFVNGNGTNKPKGFMAYTFVANASWTWGNVGYIATGVAGGFAATNPSDKLVDVIYALKAGYRQNGTWIMNRATQAAIRKFKDTAGNYLWQPAATADGNATLMNFRVMESEYMPDIGTDTHALSFGDFKRGYLIVDRVGVRLLRDPYSSKPYVLFYTTKRVGGGIQNFEAIKTLKFGVS